MDLFQRLQVKRFYIYLTALSLIGCASVTSDSQYKELATKSPCCTSFREMQFEPLQPKFPRSVAISSASPVLVLDNRKIYSYAFALPTAKGVGQRIDLQTELSGGFLGDAAFCPSITFLDQDAKVLETIIVNSHFVRPGFFSNPVFVGSVAVPSGSTRAVLHSSPAGTTVRSGSSGGGFVYMAGNTSVFVPGQPQSKVIPCTATGSTLIVLN